VLTKVRADFLTFVVREGQFVTLDQGFVFHYRERGAQGSLLGIFIQDRRDPEKISTYIAEAGVTTSSGENNFLVLEKGYVHRQERGERSSAMVQFESYALDQTTFTTEAKSLVGRGMASGSGKAVAECRDAARGIDNEYRRRKAMEGCGDRARPIIDFEAIFVPDSYKVVSFVIPALISEDVLLTNQKFAVEAYKKATGNDKVRPVQLLGVNTMNDPDLAERLGRQVDGAVFVDGFDPGDQTPLVQRFIEGFGRGMHSRPSLIDAQTYDAARLLGAVLEGQLPGQAGQKPATRGSVKRALDDVEGFVGVTGTISFDEQGDSVVPLLFFRLEREKVERVDVGELVKGAG
jgi:hypothetical protein